MSFDTGFSLGFDVAPGIGAGTAEKRRSASGIWIPLIPGVTLNVNKDRGWRQASAWSYSFIPKTITQIYIPILRHRRRL